MRKKTNTWTTSIKLYRPYLLAFTFRLTGSLAEAEDIVQETFAECLNYNPKEILNHKSWLTKICSNKALDYLKSARKKREKYVGVWLPDEVPQSLQVWNSLTDSGQPDQNLLLSETLTTTFLLLLQKLTPQERIVYLLCEVFDYKFSEVSELLNKNVSACKKIAQRARQSISAERNKFDPPTKQAEIHLKQFFNYAKIGNVDGMANLLSDNCELWGDGGGKVNAAGFINDFDSILNFFRGLTQYSDIFHSDDYRIEVHKVNSRPGIVITKRNSQTEWDLNTILSFEFKANKIACIYAQRNPDKLKFLT